MMGRLAICDVSENVSSVDGGCTHLFVVVRVAKGDNSEIVAFVYRGSRICLWWLELLMVMIVRCFTIDFSDCFFAFVRDGESCLRL